jgi:hypothetical protein
MVIYVSVIFGIVYFTAVIMPNFFFELTGINDFMTFFFVEYFWFLVQEKCLQTTLHPESGKELENLLLIGISAWKSGKSYWSGIFSVPI